jgi:hypothetical protein
MTAKRNDNGDLEVVKVGGMTFSYRTALLLLVASSTPFAEPVLRSVGLKAPPTVPSEKLLEMDKKIDDIHMDVAKIDESVKKVEFRVSGFQVDFDKYRANHP